jgi:cation-transporting P-type ATPase I
MRTARLSTTLFGLADKVARPVTDALHALVEPPVGRRIWTSGERTHIEVRGIHELGTEEAARDLKRRLTALDGVREVQVNAVMGRVVVIHDPEVVRGALSTVVAEAERDWDLDKRDAAAASAAHPGNPGPVVREAVALATNLVGITYTLLGRVTPIALLPPVVPAAASLVDSTPRLRAKAEAVLGRPTADAVFAVGGAVGQALARRPMGLLADTGYRMCLRREIDARQRAWRQWEARTADRPLVHHSEPLEWAPRPVRLPNGPIERTATASASLALTGLGGMLATGRGLQRGTAVLVACVPRATKVGRDAFAAQLAKDLSGAGTLVLDPDALRRLDRVDTVVLDSSALLTGRQVVGDIVAMPGTANPAKVLAHAHDLVDMHQPWMPRRRGKWAVQPAEQLATERPDQVPQGLPEHEGLLLAVLREDEPVGFVNVVPEADPLTEALTMAAGRAGAVVVGEDVEGLLGLVRARQADGQVVALVSAQARAALAAADVGIGVQDRDGAVPWGAHLVCPGFAEACTVLDAVEVARKASRYSAWLSGSGSALGLMLGGFGPVTGAVNRAFFAVHFVTLIALAVGTWMGAQPDRRPAPVPVDRTPWHVMTPRAALRRLESTPEGLDERESARRREQVADEEPEAPGLAQASADELAGPLTPALTAGAGVSASLGSIVDAAMIFFVLGLNAFIGGAQRVAANRELRQLLDTSALRVRLRREGAVHTAKADDLAPGDIVELHAGDAVPADCRVLEAYGVEVDESSLTGESQLVRKFARATAAPEVADRSSMLYRGSAIAAGHAVAVVVATGGRTEAERAGPGGEDAPVTGVAARLVSLTKVTLPLTVGAGVVLLVVDLIRGSALNQALGRAVGLAVAAVPEGLPFVATVAELASARRLAKRGVLVRSPSTIEALGRVDVLCFDKTGTLTEGRIRLREVSDGRGGRPITEITPELCKVLAAAMRASPWREKGPVPHPTDRAVLDGARQLDVEPGYGVGELEWIDELRFEPSRSYHAVLTRTPDGLLLSVKGAPEAVFDRCRRWRTEDGGDATFDADARARAEAEVERLAGQGYRVLAVAERSASEPRDLDESRIRALDFCGLLALADPIRPTAAGAVEQLRRAGVDIVMITGDHPSTAKAIAAELGLHRGKRVMTGAELDAASDEELTRQLPLVTVFARVSPSQKARIVQQLHRAGCTVAMTGDGANDVPAIRLAHVGIAVGAKATPAAREAADLVVTDDRIETITDALVEGRAMWSSVRDALSILLGGNFGEVAFTLAAGLLSSQEALNARQLLLVNLLTDVLPAMAVAVRPPPHATPEDLLAEGPEASLGAMLTRDVYSRAATTATAAMISWLLARPVSTFQQASTTGLVALVGAQLGQTMAVRGRTPLVLAAGAGSLLALGAVVQTPGVSQFFGCSPLMPHQWVIALVVAGAATGVDLLWRFVPRSL